MIADLTSYDYNPETLILRISSTPLDAHNELDDFLNKSMNRFCRRNIITEAEEGQIHLGHGRNMWHCMGTPWWFKRDDLDLKFDYSRNTPCTVVNLL